MILFCFAALADPANPFSGGGMVAKTAFATNRVLAPVVFLPRSGPGRESRSTADSGFRRYGWEA